MVSKKQFLTVSLLICTLINASSADEKMPSFLCLPSPSTPRSRSLSPTSPANSIASTPQAHSPETGHLSPRSLTPTPKPFFCSLRADSPYPVLNDDIVITSLQSSAPLVESPAAITPRFTQKKPYADDLTHFEKFITDLETNNNQPYSLSTIGVLLAKKPKTYISTGIIGLGYGALALLPKQMPITRAISNDSASWLLPTLGICALAGGLWLGFNQEISTITSFKKAIGETINNLKIIKRTIPQLQIDQTNLRTKILDIEKALGAAHDTIAAIDSKNVRLLKNQEDIIKDLRAVQVFFKDYEDMKKELEQKRQGSTSDVFDEDESTINSNILLKKATKLQELSHRFDNNAVPSASTKGKRRTSSSSWDVETYIDKDGNKCHEAFV